jgi:hypothetical protein
LAYTLKTTGIATKLIACVAVDEDGTTVKDFVSGNSITHNASIAAPRTGTSAWKGTTRGTFKTDYGADVFSPRGVLWNATQPSIPIGNGGNGISFFVAVASLTDSSNQYLWQLSTDVNNCVKFDGTNHPVMRTGATDQGAATTAWSTGTKFSFGLNCKYNTSGNPFYYGLESGSLAADGTFNEGGFGGTGPLNLFGGASGNGSCRGSYHIACFFSDSTLLTLSEFQSLHNDWFGTLFEAPAATQNAAAMLSGVGR